MNRVFLAIILVTFLLSIFNWYEEGHFTGFVFSNFGAIASSCLALLVLLGVSKTKKIPEFPFKFATMLSIVVSFVAYAYYAFNGQAEDSSSSAAQMHIVLVPILLFLFTVCLLLCALLASLLWKVLSSKKT